MDSQYSNFFQQIFQDFILLDSGLEALIAYVKTLQGSQKEKMTKLVLLKELASKHIKSSIIDSSTIESLLAELHTLLPQQQQQTQSQSQQQRITQLSSTLPHYQNKPKITSFSEIESSTIPCFDEELIKSKYIYSNCIVYLDSVNEYSLPSHKSIFSDAVHKPQMFRTQFNLLHYFLFENPHYKLKSQNKPNAIEVTPLGSLRGIGSDEVTVFGMLLHNEAKLIQLQDTDNTINVDISEIEHWGEGYFTPGCCVLCQGFYKNDILHAKLIMHPQPVWNKKVFEEKYERDYFGAISKAFKHGVEDEEIYKKGKELQLRNNKLNNNSSNKRNKKFKDNLTENFLNNFLNRDISQNRILYPKYTEHPIDINTNIHKLSQVNYEEQMVKAIFERSSQILKNEFFLVISNADLTNINVLNALDKIISGYTPSSSNTNAKIKIPFMIILIGNFIPEQSYKSFKQISNAFDNLCNILLKNQYLIRNCYFVIMPGPNDFALFDGFPKQQFMPNIIENIKKKVPNIINATNPCRFALFGKEVVVFRDDLNKKLSRNSIKIQDDSACSADEYVHTVLSQGNLAPVSLSVTPRIWHLGQCMSMVPLPDILILADVVEDFHRKIGEDDILVENPGNFTKDYSFVQVFPLMMVSQACKVSI